MSVLVWYKGLFRMKSSPPTEKRDLQEALNELFSNSVVLMSTAGRFSALGKVKIA